MTDYYERDERSEMARKFDELVFIGLQAETALTRLETFGAALDWADEHAEDPGWQNYVLSLEQREILRSKAGELLGKIGSGSTLELREFITELRQVADIETSFTGQQGSIAVE